MPIFSEKSKLLHSETRKLSRQLARHKVFLLPAGFSGCAFWRFRTPMAKLQKLGSVLDIHVADNPDKTLRMGEIQEQVQDAELIVLQAPGYKDALTLMKLYRLENKRIVIDYDDYSFDLSPSNPRYAELGIIETEVLDNDGKAIYSWKDGQNGFDLGANLSKFEAFKQCLRTADMVTTTTDYLAGKFKPFNQNTRICPNSVDFSLWKPIPRPPWLDKEIRIGWFGGDSHFIDLKMFKTLLPKVCKRYKQVKIVLQAPLLPEWREFFKDIPSEQLEWHPWADLRWYTLFLASKHWDIGLCPLGDDEFNRCKSSIKAFEFSALNAAVIAQDMEPYKITTLHGKTGLLAANEDQWYDAICTLVEDEKYRKELAANAYQDTFEKWNLDKNCRIWERAYIDCIEAGATSGG